MAEDEKSLEQEEAELTQQYLAGEFTEDGPVKKEGEGDTPEEEPNEEETEETPGEEGPAIKENKRLRQKNREINEAMDQMKQQLQELSEKVSKANEKPKDDAQSRLEKATIDELIEAETTIEQRLYEAYQSEDRETVNKLIALKKEIKSEIVKRPSVQMGKQQEEDLAAQQWASLEESIVQAIPEVKDSTSALYKKAEAFAKENSALMKKLGNAGGLIALAQALTLSKPSSREGKKAVKNVVEEMERIAETTTSAPKSTGASSKTTPINFNALKDEDFEELYSKMQRGEAVVPTTG